MADPLHRTGEQARTDGRSSRGGRARNSAGRRRVDPTFYSRYECKYLVRPVVVPEMREFIRPFARPDGFAALQPNNRYAVCSLYLDSEDLVLYQQTVGGEKDRFKLRVRTYSDDPGTPAFTEVKKKVNNIVHKRRAGLTRAQAARLLVERSVDWLEELPVSKRDDVDYFNHHVELIGARPVTRVKYMREAYEAKGNEPARITIDTELMHCLTLNDDLRHGPGRWTTTPLDGTIVEIKFTERYPWWIQEFIRVFDLRQQAVPKYVLSVDHLLMHGRESAITLAGMTLPPHRA